MRATLGFFAATYALTWSLWIAATLVTNDWLRPLIVLLGTFAPGAVAIWLTSRESGRTGVIALLQRLFLWRVPLRWYVFAVTYIAAIKLAVAVVYRGTTGLWPIFGAEPWYLMLAAPVGSTVVGGQAGEEVGWRGYALPRLAADFGLGPASILLGMFWACWHLPLFYLLGADTVGQSFPMHLLQILALSVAMAWLYAHSHCSLLLVMLMHSAVNNTKDIVPSAEAGAANPWALSHSPVAWTTVAILAVVAAFLLYRMRKSPDLTREVEQSIAR